MEYENFKINGLKILEPEIIYKRKILEKRNKFIKCIEEEIQRLRKGVIDKLKK